MLLQALDEFYQRATRDGLIQEAAFTNKYVRWQIPLDLDGNVQGAGLVETPETKDDKGKRQRKEFSAPRSSRPKVAGGVAEFLWEGLEAVFCLKSDLDAIEPNEKKRAAQDANRQAKCDDFWRQIEEGYAATDSNLLAALLKFRQQFQAAGQPEFLRWGRLKEGDKPGWLVRTATGGEEKFKADNFTFVVDDQLLLGVAELREFWRVAYAQEIAAKTAGAQAGVCLVSGREGVAISESHLPKLMSVPGASAMGASLVSFDKDSFRSYGLEKSYNSPVSFQAVEGYTNALNFLVSNRRYHQRIGDTALCFWVKETPEINLMVANLLEMPVQATIDNYLKKVYTGDPNLTQFNNKQFYSVTLGGNAGRVVVRHWLQITVGQALENFAAWFEDLTIAPLRSHDNDKIPPLNLFRLAVCTVREAKDLRPEVPSQLYRCALEGRRHKPSLSIAGNLLERIAIDLARDGKSSLANLSRFALLRLIVNRNRKENDQMIEPQLNNDIEDYAYNCGRLLAVFEELQAAAHDYKLEGASVVERYYGTASASPNSAFGILWRLHQHHLKKVARSNRAKAEAIKQKIAAIATHFRAPGANAAPQFPRSFNLQEQGRFALGFYQQIAADKEARDAYFQAKKSAPEGEKTND